MIEWAWGQLSFVVVREIRVVGVDVVCGDACALGSDAGKLDVGSLRHVHWYF